MPLPTLALSLLAILQSDDWAVVDLATHRSPDGTWALTVDPSRPDGGGPARTTMRRGDATVWSAELPFTLSAVAVTDAGYAVGYGYPHDLASEGELHVVSLAPDGELVLHEARQRVASRVLHGAPYPIVKGLLVDGERDVFGWRAVLDHEPHALQSLMLRRISTGAEVATLGPAEIAPPGAHELAHLEETVLLDGIGLWLCGWHVQGDDRYGTAVSLIDTTGATRWSWAFPTSRTGLDRDVQSRFERLGRIVAVAEGGERPGDAFADFATFVPAERTRVDFAVRTSGPGGVWIEEVARVRWDVPVDAPDPRPERARLELETSATIACERDPWFAGWSDAIVDGGRVLAVARDGRHLRAWDGNGRGVFTAVIPRAFGKDLRAVHLVPGPGGEVFVPVRPRGAPTRAKPWVAVGASGEIHGLFHGLSHWDFAFAPDGSSGWAIEGAFARRLVALEPDDAPGRGMRPLDPATFATLELPRFDAGERRVIARRPDGRWLRAGAVAVGADGRVAALSEGALCVFDAVGVPLLQVEEVYGDAVALAGGWALAHGRRVTAATLIRLADGAVWCVDAPLERWSFAVGFGPEGREIWWFESEDGTLTRQRLPPPAEVGADQR